MLLYLKKNWERRYNCNISSNWQLNLFTLVFYHLVYRLFLHLFYLLLLSGSHITYLCLGQELNRVRRAALSYGFGELLEGLASVLERECTLLPSSAHPEAAIQLQHAYEALRNHDKKDTRQNIVPLKTTYSGNDWYLQVGSWQMLKWTNFSHHMHSHPSVSGKPDPII